jgi:TonB-dependent SusC/RagA subfamily outer membrane receptor
MQKIIAIIGILISISIQNKAQQKWDSRMELKSCSIDIKADLFIATTFIEMEFCNPNEKEIEGLYQFDLKPGQVITAFQLDINGKYRDGSIEEKWKATNTYNTIVGKRIDPALLTMNYANHYSLRIYPIPPNGCRKVTMTVQESLVADKNDMLYSLPLNVSNTVKRFRLNISVNGNVVPITKAGLIADRYFVGSNEMQTLEWNAEDVLLKSPVAFSFPLSSRLTFCSKRINESEAFFALRIQPSSPKEYTIRPETLTVLWDASASLSRRDINKEINFLKQFISYHNISRLTIIPFNYKLLDTAIFYTENGFNSRWQQYLQNISYDGATQLGIIDLTSFQSDMFLLFSDGNNTYGKSKLKTGNALLSCITTSNKANFSSLNQIVGSGGGKVIDLNKLNISAAIKNCSKGENWLMNIKSSSGKMIVEQSIPQELKTILFINGTMSQAADTLYFYYGNNNQVNHTEKLVVNQKDCPGSGIDRLAMLNNFDQVIRTYSWSSMIDFGLQEKVVTPNTAYIVLERVEDYVKYNIAPPKELEAECERMNYVKRDTRFERKRIEKASEYDILKNVVNIFNDRIRRWDANEKHIYLEKSEFDKINSLASTDISVNNSQSVETAITGKAAGLDLKSNALEEVVVVGYGSMSRKMLTGSVGFVRSQDIFSSATTVEQALQGRVSGLQVQNSSGIPGGSSAISIRGIASLSNNQPLFVVDGIPVSGNINDIVNVHDIDNITVLKDNTASALYGSRAANGAIVINTKRGRNYFNYYNNKPYRLKDMEDVEYLQELKTASKSEKLSVYERLKEEYGGEAGFYFDVAQHFFEIGFKEQAYNILMNAAEAANGSQQVLVGIAYMLESWLRYTDAITVYEELIKSNPYNLVFHSDLAWAHYQSRNYQRAIDILFGAIKMSTAELEQSNLYLKSMMMNDMNAIISLHKNNLDISGIPAALIRPMPVDMRIVIDCNKSNISNISVKEPGNYICNYSNPVTKNGGTIQQGYYWYSSNPFEYQVKKAPEGRYRISVNFYDYYSYNGKIPSVIRIRKFKNFDKENQSIEVENVMMDNQHGEIEIGEIKWNEK